jgi:hypothetical protein
MADSSLRAWSAQVKNTNRAEALGETTLAQLNYIAQAGTQKKLAEKLPAYEPRLRSAIRVLRAASATQTADLAAKLFDRIDEVDIWAVWVAAQAVAVKSASRTRSAPAVTVTAATSRAWITADSSTIFLGEMSPAVRGRSPPPRVLIRICTSAVFSLISSLLPLASILPCMP